MGAHCGHDIGFDGSDPKFRTALIVVILINFLMFGIEMMAGHISGSQALMADALDFFADGITYTISLIVIGMALRIRSLAALAKGISLLLMGLWVMGSTLYEVFLVETPKAEIMGLIGFMALLANIASVLILMRWRDGDANVRSVWLCSRNDAIGNVAVMLAAIGVFGTGTGWPDLLVAGIMAFLFISSSIKIIKQSGAEIENSKKNYNLKKTNCCDD
ncbi:MAG: cation transporter [Alphaproteobacteria bacterium]|nr:cation transporter [Alphaproteobacteria bacterium]